MPEWPARRRSRSSPLPEPYRRRSGKGARPSPATLGLVKVDADFAAEYPDGDAASTEAYASLVRLGTAGVEKYLEPTLAKSDITLTNLQRIALGSVMKFSGDIA